MKTLYLILLSLLLSIGDIAAQEQEKVYFILTSQPHPKNFLKEDGIEKEIQRNNPGCIGDVIVFSVISKTHHIMFCFLHVTYDSVEVAKKRKYLPSDKMDILTLPESFLEFINPIDLDLAPKNWTEDQVWEFTQIMKQKMGSYKNPKARFYIIDRNDIKNGQIILYEVDNPGMEYVPANRFEPSYVPSRIGEDN